MKKIIIILLLVLSHSIYCQKSKVKFGFGLDYLKTVKANKQTFDHNKIAPHIILNKGKHSFGLGTTFSKRNYLTE